MTLISTIINRIRRRVERTSTRRQAAVQTARETIMETLGPAIAHAMDNGLVFYFPTLDKIMMPAEVRAHNAAGRYIWGTKKGKPLESKWWIMVDGRTGLRPTPAI